MDSPLQNICENLQTQLYELESLQSVFCNPGEIRVEDVAIVADIQEFVDGKSELLPPNLDYIITIAINELKFELCVNLSHEYPNTEPEIFVRNHKLNRSQHINVNKDLNNFITKIDKGEPLVFSAITWLQENASSYIAAESEQTVPVITKNENLVRYWIYSHHIYSKTKRREIIDLANSLHLTGFSLPGKPGIICVEGTTSDCDEWWHLIKSMNWKKIFCKVTEENKEESGSFLKFETFKEVVFQNSGVKCTHMDMGELYKYLEDHKVGYIFKELFGVEAKSN